MEYKKKNVRKYGKHDMKRKGNRKRKRNKVRFKKEVREIKKKR